jgi:methylenetetrahydrofolate dehydrogenase (NADP+)/methenyltetrahydrofolate cyclohydrolase
MSASIINGKEIASAIREEIRAETEALKARGIVPGLAVVLVGDDPASKVYVGNKEKACLAMGFHSEVRRLPADTAQDELLAVIDRLNEDPAIHGILVQLPLPKHIDEKAVIDAIRVDKDVDGFHPVNAGNLVIGSDSLLPCTPARCVELLKRSGIGIAGKHVVVIGRSNIVGKPAALLMLREHATVTICHSRTTNLEEIARQADILVVAIGKAKAIDARYVKPGAVVLDVGVNRMPDGKYAGDVDFDSVSEVAGWITPVPGGVGPMTITMLLRNTLTAAKRIHGIG